LHEDTISNYHVEGQNTVSYSCRMDETIGDFSYGEVGLYLDDGTLFALASLDTAQPKVKSAGLSPGNSVEIIAKLSFTNLPGLIDFTVLAITEAKALELVSVDLLDAPIFSNSNFYLCHSGDDEGNPVLAIRDNNYKWRFSTHKHVLIYGAVDNTGASTVSQVYSADVSTLVTGAVAGRYIIQFTTGAWRGLARNIDSSVENMVHWATPLGGAPNEGDEFEIYVSDVYVLASAEASSDDLMALVLAFGSSNTE
jgi:hypothetical protein